MASWQTARAALDAGAWLAARDDFLAVAEATGDPAAYDQAAQGSWWLDDAATCLAAREQAYRRYREREDDYAAAAAATALAYDSVLFGAGLAVGQGWLGRAGALLERHDESPEHGWVEVRRAELALHVQHDPGLGRLAAERAEAIAGRIGHGELEIVAVGLQGLALTQSGHIDSGMSRLDTAVAAATAGDLTDVMWMGKVCCWLIAACEQTQDLTRAADWCRRVEAVCLERDLVPLFNVCRILYASVKVSQGSWPEAERELTGALDRLTGSRRAARLDAVVQLGELRRRQGRLDEADALFAQAEFHLTSVAGRARIKLAQGDAEAAWAGLSGLLRSLPEENVLLRAQYLLPAVRAAHAAGDLGVALLAVEELERTAAQTGTDALVGLSAVARARLAEVDAAVPLLREGVRRFSLAGLRYDEAETRLELAEALIATGDVAAAQEQLETALPQLIDLSANTAVARARKLQGSRTGPASGPLTAREVDVLTLVAQGLSNRDIAAELVVSEHTVHRHVSNVLVKLDQHSRAGAVAAAIGLGLLPT